jgi:hypothetical protein
MESVTAVSNFLEVGCDDEWRKAFKKQKISFVTFYVISFAVVILICTNTILLDDLEKKGKPKLGCHIQHDSQNLTFVIPKCLYVEKYPLGNEVYIRICQSNVTTLDIRHVINGKEMLNGIQITKMQWQYLKTSINHIHSSLLKMANSIEGN